MISNSKLQAKNSYISHDNNIIQFLPRKKSKDISNIYDRKRLIDQLGCTSKYADILCYIIDQHGPFIATEEQIAEAVGCGKSSITKFKRWAKPLDLLTINKISLKKPLYAKRQEYILEYELNYLSFEKLMIENHNETRRKTRSQDSKNYQPLIIDINKYIKGDFLENDFKGPSDNVPDNSIGPIDQNSTECDILEPPPMPDRDSEEFKKLLYQNGLSEAMFERIMMPSPFHRPKSRFPMQLNETYIAYAASKGRSIQSIRHMYRRFCAYHTKTRMRHQFRDWYSAWIGWVDNNIAYCNKYRERRNIAA